MPETTPQNYANHTRFDPKFHFFIIPVFVFTFLLSIWNLIKNFGFVSAWMVVVSLGWISSVPASGIFGASAGFSRYADFRRMNLLP